jgi:hypothetical protein
MDCNIFRQVLKRLCWDVAKDYELTLQPKPRKSSGSAVGNVAPGRMNMRGSVYRFRDRGVLLHRSDAAMHGLAGRIHLASADDLFIGGEEEKIRPRIIAALFLVVLVEGGILPDRGDSSFGALLAFVRLAGENHLVIRGLQVKTILAVRRSPDLKCGFHTVHSTTPVARMRSYKTDAIELRPDFLLRAEPNPIVARRTVKA